LADPLTLVAVALSVVTLAAVLLLAITIRRRATPNEMDTGGLASTIGEVKGSVSDLHTAVNQLHSMFGEIKQATSETSSGMVEMRKFAELLSGSSQKRGAAGEIIVRSYLERLPKEMWEEQFYLPGSSDRVDYALRMNNGGVQLFLPIDAKFILPDGIESFEDEANKLARKRAEELVKYIAPGVTTDFAVMVVPTSVFYALTSETVGAIQDIRVVACPPEGVIILCSLAMRAHQAMVIAQSAERLTTYVNVIDGKLEQVGDDVGKLAKNLKGAWRYATKAAEAIEGTRSELDNITTHLGEVAGAKSTSSQLQTPTPVLVEETATDSADET